MSKTTVDGMEKITQEVKVGDLISWSTGRICLVCYNHIVDLENPNSTWNISNDNINTEFKKGLITVLPKGVKVTIEQE